MARPTKLTDDLQARIIAIVRAGNTLDLAAVAVGIGPRTLHRWLARGERGGAANSEYRAFRQAVEQARGEAEVALVARMARAAANGSWKAALALLERQYPERWGPPANRPQASPEPDPLDALDELAARRRRPRA